MPEARFNDISYQRFLDQEKLMGCRCTSCGARYVPPRPLCTKCYSAELEWIEYSGQGRLAAFTCIRIIPPTMQVWGYGRQNPYCSGVVELEEGGRVVALIDEVDPTRPERDPGRDVPDGEIPAPGRGRVGANHARVQAGVVPLPQSCRKLLQVRGVKRR